MREHVAHMWMCVAVVALVLVVATGSGAWSVLPLLACGLMMGAMMLMMMGGRGGGS